LKTLATVAEEKPSNVSLVCGSCSSC